MARKPYTRSVRNLKMAKHELVLAWIKSKPVYFLVLLLTIAALVLILMTFKTSSKELDIQVQPNVVLNQQNNLEIQLEKQNALIKKLEETNLALENSLKSQDKRIQANTEIIKRMCEYIWVITIDKKIAPRQCYPEYNWRREEINGN